MSTKKSLVSIILSFLVFSSLAQNYELNQTREYLAFQDSIRKKLIYPVNALKRGIQGIVHVQFRIDESYHIIPESVRVVSGLTASCDELALRVVREYKGSFPSDSIQIPFVAPIEFKITDMVQTKNASPKHHLQPFKAVVLAKGVTQGYPNWQVYPTAAMVSPKKSVLPGDTVTVTGWSAWTYYIENAFTSGFISYKALTPSPTIDSLSRIIEERSPGEEEPAEKTPPPVTYDTARIFKDEQLWFAIESDKKSLLVGECAAITMSFNVMEDNKRPIQFFDLGAEVQRLSQTASFSGQMVMREFIEDIAAETMTGERGTYYHYPIYRASFCATKPGNVVLPSQKLKMSAAKDLTKPFVRTVVTFASAPLALTVMPFPEGVSVSSFGNFKMVGDFNFTENLSTDSIHAKQRFEYTLRIESASPTFPIEPPVFAVPGINIQLVDIEDKRDTANQRQTKIFKYECIAEAEGMFDMANKITFRYFNSSTGKTTTWTSSKKIIVKSPTQTTDEFKNPSPFFTKNIFIAMDISQSMMIEDYKPTRMEAVRSALKKFSQKHSLCKVGIIYFGSNAKHLKPGDACFPQAALDSLTHNDVIQGTAIGDVIWLASVSARKGAPTKIIVIGDGDNTAGYLEPGYAATFAKQKGAKVYSIGVGNKGDVPYGSDFFGRPNMISNTFSDIDFKTIARLTSAQYFWAKDEDAIVAALEKIFLMP